MDIKSLQDDELLTGVRTLRLEERRLDRKIIEYISEIDSRRLYIEFGFSNLIDWLIRDLGYSESSAYRRAMASRAIKEIPEALLKIEEGALNLVGLSKMQSAIKAEEKRSGEKNELEIRQELIRKSEGKTQVELDKLICEQFPEAKIRQQQVALSEETLAALARVQELRSHANFGASLDEIICLVSNDYLDRHDPLRREVKMRRSTTVVSQAAKTDEKMATTEEAKPQKPKEKLQKQKKKSQKPKEKASPPERKPVAPSIENFVRRRADDACEFVAPEGHRCGSRFLTEIEHIVPVAYGGTNEIENLKVLCRAHNQLMADRAFGAKKMQQHRKHLEQPKT